MRLAGSALLMRQCLAGARARRLTAAVVVSAVSGVSNGAAWRSLATATTPPNDGLAFLKNLNLSGADAKDRERLSKLIQEVVATKSNTGGASLVPLHCGHGHG